MATNDPQRDDDRPAFPSVRVDRLIHDGEVVRLGSLRLTAHAAPGHAPSGTSWSWLPCENRVCHDLVFANSLSAVSIDHYRFSGHAGRVAALRASFATVAELRCDLVITPHPSASDLYARLAGKASLVNPRGCVDLAAKSAAKLNERLQEERTDGRKL